MIEQTGLQDALDPRPTRDRSDACGCIKSQGSEKIRESQPMRNTASRDDVERDHEMRVLVDAIPALVWRASLDGAAEFFNRRWLEYTGLSFDEARGWRWIAAIPPDDQERLTIIWREICRAGQPAESDARLRGADGVYRWFLFRGVPLRNRDEQITGWCGTNIDIEDRKRVEGDLIRSKAILDETQRVTRCGSMG
jgi:PAS domain S-box-containing protein